MKYIYMHMDLNATVKERIHPEKYLFTNSKYEYW